LLPDWAKTDGIRVSTVTFPSLMVYTISTITCSELGGRTCYHEVLSMSNSRSRMARENKTIETMITMHCHSHHKTRGLLCKDCQRLLDYARERLAKCPFQEGKPTCARCRVHCYNPVMKSRVKAVMRYAGPRMAYRHPLLTLFHFIDGRKDAPLVILRKEAIDSDRESG
jgi:hypothetical protein